MGKYLIGLALVVILLGGAACSGEDQGAQPQRGEPVGGTKATTEKRQGTAGTAIEATGTRVEEQAVGVGGVVVVGDLSFRVFDVRSEAAPSFVPAPGEGPVSLSSPEVGHVAVDFVAENTTSSAIADGFPAELVDALGNSHPQNALAEAWPVESEDDMVEPSEADVEFDPGEKKASTT